MLPSSDLFKRSLDCYQSDLALARLIYGCAYDYFCADDGVIQNVGAVIKMILTTYIGLGQ